MRNNSCAPQACGDKPFYIISPADGDCLASVGEISGSGRPCLPVSISIDSYPAIIVQADECGSWSLANPYTLQQGCHQIRAVQWNNGCCCVVCVCFCVSHSVTLGPPTIETPPNGAIIMDRRPVISGHADPGNVVTVCLSGVGCMTALADAQGRYAVQFPEQLPDGSYVITATQQDAAGNVSSPAQSTFTVAATMPLAPPIIETPPDGAVIQDRRPVISGRADPGNTVTVCLDGRECMNTTADANGYYSVQFPDELPDGPYTITATQQDDNGNVSPEATSTFTVENVEPLAPPTIDNPPYGATIYERQPVISGRAEPGNQVTVCIIGYGCVDTTAGPDGIYEVLSPVQLPVGTFTVTAFQTAPDGRTSGTTESIFSVAARLPVPPPTIDTPANGAVIADPSPFITGRGEPGYTVRLCLDGIGCQTAVVDENGEYRVQFPNPLPDRVYVATAVQIDSFGNVSTEVTSSFRVATADLLVEPISIRMGDTFRTVEVTFTVSGNPGPATVYYLMLPPNSPAPTVDEMINGPAPAMLVDGTAARGSFQIDVIRRLATITRELRGREPGPIVPNETGAVDGYVYDVYLYVVITPEITSGIVTFGASAMAMPFDGGSGTAADPWQVRELTPAELSNYPDLQAGHPINEAGVNQTARMLANIERLAVLYDDTDRLYGTGNSLSQHYILTSDFDLAGYTAAYGGDGWRPIGDFDASPNGSGPAGYHIFTGTLTGQTGGTTISNLPLSPHSSAGRNVTHVGLIGAANGAVVENIIINGATVTPYPAADTSTLRAGTLIGSGDGVNITDISVNNSRMTFPAFESQSFLLAGGVVGSSTGCTVTGVNAYGITMEGPGAAYNYCGGCVGYVSNSAYPYTVTDSGISNFRFNGFIGTNDFVGGFTGFLYSQKNVTLESNTVNDVSMMGDQLTGGGLIGYLYVRAPVVIDNITITTVAVSSAFNGYYASGLIGDCYCYEALTVFAINVSNAQLSASYGVGGTNGHLSVYNGGSVNLYDLHVGNATITAAGSYSGGLVGFFYREWESSFYLHDAEVTAPTVITGHANMGGLMGDSFHTQRNSFVYIERCTSAAQVQVNDSEEPKQAGGLIGFANYTAMRDCLFTGSVNGFLNVGGLIGAGSGLSLENCICTGPVTGENTVGGLIGQFGSTPVDAEPDPNPPFAARENVMTLSSMRGPSVTSSATGSQIGGIAGFLHGSRIERTFSTAQVIANGATEAGGIVGQMGGDYFGSESIIINSYSAGTVTGAGEYGGGVVGNNVGGTVENCYGAGSVTAQDYAGGVAGVHNSPNTNILYSFALNPLVSAQGPNAARIANGSGTLHENYAVTTLNLEKNGVPATPVPNPNGPDGGDVLPGAVKTQMQNLGWQTAVWDFNTLPDRPMLVDNEE